MERIYKEKAQCCGCGACVDICPVDAVCMIKDSEGFAYPQVDQEKCIDCGQCVRVCSYFDNRREKTGQEYYAVKHKSEQIVINSSSGGAFTALSDVILRKGGCVYGAAFSEEFDVRHIRTANEKQRDLLRGSKYVQSDMIGIMKQIAEDLVNGLWVLFSGTPCQTAGVRRYIEQKSVSGEKLVLCDFICHGVASPEIWKKYVAFLNCHNSEKVSYFTFREKDKGWHNFYSKIMSGDKDISSEYSEKNSYFKIYGTCYINRPICYACNYTSYDRVSDITLGDFWNIKSIAPEMDDNKGTSMLMINSLKGKELLDLAKDNLITLKCEKADVWQPHLEYANELPAKRKRFWRDYREQDFEKILHIYGKGNLIGNCKRIFGKIVKRIGVYVWAGKMYRKVFIRGKRQ